MEPRPLLPPLLQIKDLRLLLPTPEGGWHSILAGVTLQVDQGEAVGLCGPSGGGKTQTGLALLGLWPRHARVSGSIRLEPVGELIGRANLDWRDIRGRRLAMVFQDPAAALNPLLSVGRHLAEVLRADGKPRKQWRRRGLELLEMVAMPDPAFFERRYPHQLSGGQRQRLMIALALARDPSLLIADEPTTALDVTIQAQILDLLLRLRRELRLAILLISHDRRVVASLCERIVWIQHGTTSTEAAGRDASGLVGAA